MLNIRMIAAALAAVLAMSAAAQQEGPNVQGPFRKGPGQTPSAQPQPAPAAQGQATGQQAQGQPLATEEQRAAFGKVHAQNQLAAQIGDMAAARGASPEVQNLGRSLAADHRRIDGELGTLLKARGLDVNALAPGPERAQLETQIAQLGSKSGEEFDREFVSFLTRNGVSFVDALKHARDVIPGKDGQLKKFLDDAENSEENHLAASRQLKSQRQARKPPAK